MKRTSNAFPTVDLDSTRCKLERLGLEFVAPALPGFVSEAVKEEQPPHILLDRLLELELQMREERRVSRALRLSGLPQGPSIANFDFGFQPSIERSRIESLATCQYIRDCATILLQGPPGVGKTHLAIALGTKAVANGFSVAFFRLTDLIDVMRKDQDVSSDLLRRRKYMNSALIVIDEVGFEPMNRPEASLFFRLVSHRYLRGATIITTNKSVKDWPEILAGDEVMTTAVLDRLLHRSHVFNIRGRSYRLKDLENLTCREQPDERGRPRLLTYGIPSLPQDHIHQRLQENRVRLARFVKVGVH